MAQQLTRSFCAAKASPALYEQLSKALETEGEEMVKKFKVACCWLCAIDRARRRRSGAVVASMARVRCAAKG